MEGHLRLTGQSHFFHQIYLIPQILLKSRLLIGRQLQMLASDWSRGSVENDQRGTPLRCGGTFEIDCQSHLSPSHLGGWAPMEGHLRLTGQSQMSLLSMEGHLRLTFNLICPRVTGEAGHLWRDI